jgi:multidrug efflux pump
VKFFIDRPVFASVLSILIVLAGVLSLNILPIEQYPQIVPPEVVVTAVYNGASAETVATTVAAPLEDQINGVNHMLYMRSTCDNNGQLNLTVTFEVGADADQATIDVNNRVQAALSRLPEQVKQVGVTVRKRSSSMLQVVALGSKDHKYDSIYMSNYALLNVIDDLKRIPGVGEASLFGAKNYAMRIWLNPDLLIRHDLTALDVASAIQEQNFPYAVGSFGQEPSNQRLAYTFSATTKGQLLSPEEFGQIILRSDENGAKLLLKEVAKIELGAQDYGFEAVYRASPCAPIGIYLQPEANALDTANRVQMKLEELSKNFPEGMFYFVPYDTTLFVKSSIKEVLKTLAEAMLLVIVIVYLFLQSGRATLIPLIAVPISLIGTLAGLYVLGFSINLLTLFALVLAIGIVVDDAIVVLENVERLIREEKLSPRAAAIASMEQVASPVIAIVLVLCAVFVPVGFMGGLTGVMYRQFAITIAVSVVISGFVALTLTPALCALFLKGSHQEHKGLFALFNTFFEWATRLYIKGVSFIIHHAKLGLLAFSAVFAACALLYQQIPSSLVPEEDQGLAFVATSLLPGSSLKRTQEVTSQVMNILNAQPEAEEVITLSGFDLLSASQKTSAGVSFVRLKDWQERLSPGSSAQSFAGRVTGLCSHINDGMSFAFCPPPISGLSMTGGFEFYLENHAGESIGSIAAMADRYLQLAAKRPELAGMRALVSVNTPQYDVQLDRNKTKALGVSLDEAYATMQSTIGSSYINDFTLYGRTFRVYLQSQAPYRESSDDLSHVFVRSKSGGMIPLSSLVTIKNKVGPDLVERFNGFPSVKLMGNPAPGYSSGQAIQAAEEVFQDLLSSDYTIGWTGSAYQEKMAGGSDSAFIFGLFVVFLILAALYERWTLPIAVIAAVPFAVLGALFFVWLRGLNNDIYLQVALVTLIGLAAKNAILIVEFALIQREEGVPLDEAILTAAKLRFRPIIMTSMAFILGCLPLVISTGAGAASRHSLGTGVVGGMLGATFLAIFFIPLFFKLVMQFEERFFPKRPS